MHKASVRLALGSFAAFAVFIGTVSAAPLLPFTDIGADATYASAVQWLWQARIVNGHRNEDGQYNGLFRPADNITLAETLKIALLASKRSIPDAGVPSNLSAQGTWAGPYANAGAQQGFSLFKNNRLDVFRTATKTEVIATLLEAFKISQDSPSNPLRDVANTPVTRGEVAVWVTQLMGIAPQTVAVQSSSSVASAPAAVASSSSTPTITPPAVSSSSVPAASVTGATHRVAVASANMRSGAGMAFRVIRVLKQDELLIWVSQQDPWVEVQLADGTKGFLILNSIAALQPGQTVNVPVVTPPPASTPPPAVTGGTTGTITGPVNVRARADIESAALFSIPAGTPVTILEQSHEIWLRIRLGDGREGYVSRKFVKF